MDDQPTAWEDINPGMVRRESSLPVPASSRAALSIRVRDVHDLEPVDRDEFFAEVGPCLALTMGVGMSQGDQDAWLEAAFIALAGIPITLLQFGIRAAMKTADHPSKIVPAIMAEIGQSWNWRRQHRPAPPKPISPSIHLTVAERVDAQRERERANLNPLTNPTTP